jgi:uncharacterized phage protein (predicted DNA packaging)
MPIVSATDLAEHLNLPSPTATADGDMLDRLAAAAQGYVEAHIGFTFAERYEEDPPPEPLLQAVLMLASHWYEMREATSAERIQPVPFGLMEIIQTYRDWTF